MDRAGQPFDDVVGVAHSGRVKIQVEGRVITAAADPAAGTDLPLASRQDLADIGGSQIELQVVFGGDRAGRLQK